MPWSHTSPEYPAAQSLHFTLTTLVTQGPSYNLVTISLSIAESIALSFFLFFPITLAINDVRLLCHGSENYILPKEMETQRRLRDGSISDTF
jgi:hypothetical protein